MEGGIMKGQSHVLSKAIMDVVENQIILNDPPETKQTLERLIAEGYSRIEAKVFIGDIYFSELLGQLQAKKLFNPERYVSALSKLPKTSESLGRKL